MRWGDKKWRHIYRYVCKLCGKIRYTKDFDRHKREVCTLCEPQPAPENMQSLFDNKPQDEQIRQEGEMPSVQS